jgi:oligopeptide/dipeptide ABC transporter ATP-binding protein
MGNSKKAAVKKAKELLEVVQLNPSMVDRYPHQLSGGQQQRMSIARALITDPDIMVLDEPTSALDISIQAQILNLLIKLQRDFDLTYLFITHDLNVVRYISDRIAVMYLGKIVEYGDVDAVFNNPSHPYTVGLLNSSPVTNPRNRNEKKLILKGEPDSMINLPKGCRLTSRCPFVREQCSEKVPDFIDVGNGHHVSCIRAREIKELTT